MKKDLTALIKEDILRFEQKSDIYVISFFINENYSNPTVSVGNNTYAKLNDEIKNASDIQEAKWNFAFWLMNWKRVLGKDDGTDKLLKKWVADISDKTEDIMQSFIDLLIDIVIELHSSNWIKKHFGRDVIIIIHGLEYYGLVATQNISANTPIINNIEVKELLDDFVGFCTYSNAPSTNSILGDYFEKLKLNFPNENSSKKRLYELRELGKELEELHSQYDTKFHELMSDADKNSHHIRYGIGCKFTHRGYFRPNPIEELIIGNGKRGKLKEKLTASSKNYYEYHFDKFDNLICSKKYSDKKLITAEFIWREDNKEYALDFDVVSRAGEQNFILLVTICEYDDHNNIKSLKSAQAFPKMVDGNILQCIDFLNTVFFVYDEEQHITYADFAFGTSFQIDSFSEDRIHLFYDNDNIVKTETECLDRYVDLYAIEKLGMF